MDGMMDGMKKQAVMMYVSLEPRGLGLMCRVPNMVLMQYISAFFSGFILSESFRTSVAKARLTI